MDADALLLETILAALDETTAATMAALQATGLSDVEPLDGFFMAGLHQKLFCLLCGADPTTFSGGDAKTAAAIIRNSQQIARHYWGAEIASRPTP